MPRAQFKAPQVLRGRIWTADAGTYGRGGLRRANAGPGVRPEPLSHRDADGTAASLGDCVHG
jgi:hypothetical protein